MNLMDLVVGIRAEDKASGQINNLSESISGGLVGAAKKAVGVLGALFALDKIKDFGQAAVEAYSNYEQMVGGVEKIFDEMDTSRIYEDASRAYMELNMSANEYMATINNVGATFSATMGDEKGYETARRGMLAISDYASGTGRSVDELNQKYQMISRSTSSYQSIADQFAGILPQTSADFLKQAQAAGYLSDEYTSLTEVPVAEYQEALTYMLEDGTAALGLQGNTAAEAANTISGSLAAMKAAWQDWLTSLMSGDDEALGDAQAKLIETVGNFVKNLAPVIIEGIQQIVASIPSMLTGLGDIGIKIADQIWPGFGDAFNKGLSSTLDGSAFDGLIEAGQRLKEAWDEAMKPFTENMPSIEETAERIGEIIGSIVDFLERLGTGILDGLRSVFESEAFQGAVQALKEAFDHMKEALAPIGEALGIINDHAGGIGEVIGKILGYGLEGIILTISGLIQGISFVIQGLISVIQWLADKISEAVQWIIDKWNACVQFFTTLPDKIRNAVSRIKEILTAPFKAAWEFIQGIPDKIRGIFNNLQIKLPHIKLPHFKINNWSWNPADWIGNPPSIGIDWYAKGGVFTEPTVAGLGEAGPERAQPLSGPIADAYDRKLARYLAEETNFVIDYQQIGIEVAHAMEGMKIAVNDREMGRLVRSYA